MAAIKDSLIYLVGEVLSKLTPFLLLPYLSRRLGVEGYGELSYYQTYLSLLAFVIGLSQDGAVSRYFYFYGKRSLNLIVSTGYFYSIVIGGISCIFFFLAKSEILVYISIIVIFQSFINIQLSVYQCQRKAILYALIQGSLSIFNFLFTILILDYYDANLVEKRMLAMLIAYFITFTLIYLGFFRNTLIFKNYSMKNRKNAFFYILGFGVPLLFHHASFFIKGQLDRIFIYHNFTEFDLGIYAMGAQIASILSFVILAINRALTPYFFYNLKHNKITLKNIYTFTLLSFLIFPIPSIAIFITPEKFFTFFIGESFLGIKYYIVLFLFSNTLTIPYLILVNYLFYYGKNNVISLCSIASTVIYILMLAILASLSEIKYIPYASIVSAFFIIPILFFGIYRVDINKQK